MKSKNREKNSMKTRKTNVNILLIQTVDIFPLWNSKLRESLKKGKKIKEEHLLLLSLFPFKEKIILSWSEFLLYKN